MLGWGGKAVKMQSIFGYGRYDGSEHAAGRSPAVPRTQAQSTLKLTGLIRPLPSPLRPLLAPPKFHHCPSDPPSPLPPDV